MGLTWFFGLDACFHRKFRNNHKGIEFVVTESVSLAASR